MIQMLQDFWGSWDLFKYAYLEGWLVGLLLALVGVVVVARDQIFLGAAVSQASTLGIALALSLSTVFPFHHLIDESPHGDSWFCCDSFQAVLAVVFSMLAALVTSWASRAKRESHEAITGWVFLLSSSLAVLLVARSQHGMEEVQRIVASKTSIIGATVTDVKVFAVLLVITVLFIALAHRRLLLFVMDPPMASAVGLKVGRWAVGEALWLGLAVGLSIRASGMLQTFGSLVLPPLIAKNLCREVRWMFVVAPLVALVTNTVGFILANHFEDVPPTQVNVALASLLLLAVWLSRWAWRSVLAFQNRRS